MSQYAANTTVSSFKSREEIERTLTRYGAEQFMYGRSESHSIVAFRAHDRQIKFLLPMPNPNDELFLLTPAKRQKRTPEQAEAAYEQAVRQKWRALTLAIKAKLEAVESGIAEFENEFMANIVLPGNQTVGEFMRPQIKHAYETGDMPQLLLGYDGS